MSYIFSLGFRKKLIIVGKPHMNVSKTRIWQKYKLCQPKVIRRNTNTVSCPLYLGDGRIKHKEPDCLDARNCRMKFLSKNG
jgi:hypothetical protein